jgi:hypothetical protein
MAEEAEGQDTGAEASGAGVDPAAVALAHANDHLATAIDDVP